MRMFAHAVGVGLLIAAVSACSDPLTVQNPDEPDVERAYSTPAGIENVISTTYLAAHQATIGGGAGGLAGLQVALQVMSLENYATVANNGMAVRVSVPRFPISNVRGNQTLSENVRDFDRLSRLSRTASDGILALDRLVNGGATLGSTAQDARARSFAFFSLGVALGNLSLVYDSAAIVTPAIVTQAVEGDSVPDLSGYKQVNTAALAMLDSAVAIAQSTVTGTNGFPLPATWINGVALSRDDFVRFARSHKARFRAGVARTPAERTAVDWAAVIADANAGLASDFNVTMSASAGWTMAWTFQHHVFQGWHQLSPFYWGMADVSGGYDNWLATGLGGRSAFLFVTPDKRFPQGATRAAQQAASPVDPVGFQYIRNRPSGDDTPGDPWGTSQYDHYRFKAIRTAGNNGPYPVMTKAEIDLLAAEGYLRTGNIAAAAAIIDRTRVARGGLPAVTGAVANATDPIPGGASCVPRVPAAPAFTSTACGNVLEALKWEKRIETAFTGYGQWYFDGRGWGDLVTATPLQYPTPYQEMDRRARPFYDLGGAGSLAAKGTYGF